MIDHLAGGAFREIIMGRANCLRLSIVGIFLLSTLGLAHSADLAFFVKNGLSKAVAIELFSQDRNTVWPGDDKVFMLEPHHQKSVPITCNEGERICYGAWVVGNDNISAGVGPDNDQPCENCCFTCVPKTTRKFELVE